MHGGGGNEQGASMKEASFVGASDEAHLRRI